MQGPGRRFQSPPPDQGLVTKLHRAGSKSTGTERWDCTTSTRKAMPEVDAFLVEILAVCRKHGMTISHEDGHGGFIIEPPSEFNEAWLLAAAVNLRSGKA